MQKPEQQTPGPGPPHPALVDTGTCKQDRQCAVSASYWGIFIFGLTLSGITAFPLVHESALLLWLVRRFAGGSALHAWIATVHDGLLQTARHFPFLAYGTDWLAFAHLLFALLFVGPYRDPLRNRWVIEFGLLACAAVLPLALIAGPLRGIPLFWRLGDCCFGIVGAVPLLLALREVQWLERVCNERGNNG